MDTASCSWGFLGNEEGPGARTQGLTQLGGSDGEAWGLVTSPLCPEAAAGREGPLCSEESGPQWLVQGRGVSRRQLLRGHGSDLAAQVGPQSGACGQCGLGGGALCWLRRKGVGTENLAHRQGRLGIFSRTSQRNWSPCL